VNTLTGADVWKAITADPAFAAEMVEGTPEREVIKPFIEAAPTALAEFLDQPFTLKAYADSKVTFLRYCIGNGIADKLSEAFGMSASLVRSALGASIDMLAELIKDVPAFLALQNVTEDQVMLGPKVGLNDANKELYKAGQLTIADVLRTQPTLILKNSK